MRLNFIFPQALWLLLLIPPLWAVTLIAPHRLARWRFWSSLLVRTCALLGLILGLAGAQLVRPVGTVTTVFLLDGSDSVSLSQRAHAETFMHDAIAHMPVDDRAAIVVFGKHALVERPPSSERVLGQIVSQPNGNATNIQDAVQLGLSLLPAEGHQRLVLLSDGDENTGNARDIVRIAAERGVPIDIVALNGLADGIDAQVNSVELPASAREGQNLRMRIEVESNTATSGRLTVEGSGGAVLVDQQVQVPAGTKQLEVVLPSPRPGFNRYVVRFNIPHDARPENNAAEAYSFITGQPQVLLVEGVAGDASNLAHALVAAQIEVTTVAPASMPSGLADLSLYDTVVLVNVPRLALTDRTIGSLSAYVHDLGRSLMMVGGTQSFGPGSWRDTPIEKALPVTMDIPSQIRFPPVSIVVLVDVSGSMGQKEGEQTKLQLAATGAQQIATLMRDEDELTVIPFDTQSENVIGPILGRDRAKAIDALNQMHVGGGGIDIHDGLEAAAQFIRQSKNPVRHLITITDGGDTVQQEGALDIVRQLHDTDRVTLSSIAVGEGKDVPFIRDMARIGEGRTFVADKAANIPAILVDETKVVIQPYIVEKQFTPTQEALHPILHDITQVPQLYGYVTTTPKQTAQVLLAAPQGEPVLAVWQYGLGRALAWTSDLKGQWGKDWVQWGQFPRFSAQMLSWLLPTQNAQTVTVESTSSANELILNAEARNAAGGAQTGLQMKGHLLAADGSATEVDLREVGAGRYRATVSDARPGAYLMQLVAQDARGQPFGALTAGVIMPRSAEYLSHNANPALLEAIAHDTGGRRDPAPPAAFDANIRSQGSTREIGLPLAWLALLLLPFDIGLRRLLFGRHQLAAWLQRVGLQRIAGALQDTAAQRSISNDEQQPVKQTANTPAPAVSLPKASKRTKPAPDLERLREAQERARRRARGEE